MATGRFRIPALGPPSRPAARNSTQGLTTACASAPQGDGDSAGQKVYGDYTFLNDAFTYEPNAPATGTVARPTHSDYLSPASGVVTGQTPMFTWKPIAGANAYWVIIARDPTFTTLVDYGFTQIPAYVPRRTYADETTSYYWAILPAANANGTGLPVVPETTLPLDPLHACDPSIPPAPNICDFQKRSTPPTLISPTNGSPAGGDPAVVPVDTGAGNAQLPARGIHRPVVRHASHERRDRVDRLREHDHVSGTVDALLEGAGERRGRNVAHVVEHRDVQAGSPDPAAARGFAVRRRDPDVELGFRQRSGRLRRECRAAEWVHEELPRLHPGDGADRARRCRRVPLAGARRLQRRRRRPLLPACVVRARPESGDEHLPRASPPRPRLQLAGTAGTQGVHRRGRNSARLLARSRDGQDRRNNRRVASHLGAPTQREGSSTGTSRPWTPTATRPGSATRRSSDFPSTTEVRRGIVCLPSA